jgi:hypothetical protein
MEQIAQHGALYDPAADRVLHFTNSGVIVGTEPLKLRLDLREQVLEAKILGAFTP